MILSNPKISLLCLCMRRRFAFTLCSRMRISLCLFSAESTNCERSEFFDDLFERGSLSLWLFSFSVFLSFYLSFSFWGSSSLFLLWYPFCCDPLSSILECKQDCSMCMFYLSKFRCWDSSFCDNCEWVSEFTEWKDSAYKFHLTLLLAFEASGCMRDWVGRFAGDISNESDYWGSSILRIPNYNRKVNNENNQINIFSFHKCRNTFSEFTNSFSFFSEGNKRRISFLRF